MLFYDFRYQSYVHRKFNAEQFLLERTLFRRKKMKATNVEMEDQNIDKFSEGHSDHNEIPRLREPTLGDCWRLVMNEDYSGIPHQFIDANNFK